MNDCIFCKIANREIEKEFTYEDKNIMVFADIHPVAPVHLLIMPKKHIKDFLQLSESGLWEELKKSIHKMIKAHKIEDKGYRLVINGGGAQIIDHLHIHLMGKIGQKIKV
ncbi:HIT domain-containing protein [Candidatus Roizmanbacteria bacterium]|nr:HIT domain-containing protein [Candidatus Roizmanbacteria bacterium]